MATKVSFTLRFVYITTDKDVYITELLSYWLMDFVSLDRVMLVFSLFQLCMLS